MKTKSVKKGLAKENLSIKEVMRIIDHSGYRLAYIVDEQGKFEGIVSDSEIRKAIIKGSDINSSIKNIINFKPIILHEKELNDMFIVKEKIRALQNKMPDSTYILVLTQTGFPKFLLSCDCALSQEKKKEKQTVGNVKSLLVVGGAGYLGSVLVRKLLDKGHRVKVLDVLLYGIEPIQELLANNRFEFINGDMRNISTLVRALDGVDSVINLAAIVGDPACKNKPEVAIETNYLANKALAEACKYHQVNRFIYASTCSVYGQMMGEKELDENSPLNPVSLYARSKIQSEIGVFDLEDENFSPTILRMGTLYGYSPRMRFDLVFNSMVKSAVTNNKIFVHSGGKQWRPLLNVEDAARAFIKCLEAPLRKIKGEVFNVGSSRQNIQIIEISKVVNSSIPKAKIILDKENLDARNYLVSFSKIENRLKFRAREQFIQSIRKIKRYFDKGKFKNPNDSRYYNVENV
jgi:nucleoside-diphosphate-sugar epimerase